MGGASGDDPDGDEDATEPSGQRLDAEATGEGDDPDGVASDSIATDSDHVAADSNSTTSSSAADDSVDAAEIDPSELTVSERSLHPRVRILWIVRAAVWAVVLGAIASAGAWVWLDVGLAIPAAITGVLLVLFVAHAILRYRAWSYEFREDAIYLERGVLTRVRTVVPFVRIQHIDTARGPIERAAGLSTLVVYTAGSRGADVTIPGIEADRATDHQRRLKQLAIAAEDDTAV